MGGGVTRDSSENIRTNGIKWNVYGKITEILRNSTTSNSNVKRINYTYDAAGNRISKRVTRFGTNKVEYTWYVRDAQGNTLHTYSAARDTLNTDTTLAQFDLLINESYIFGSSRVGQVYRNSYAESNPGGSQKYNSRGSKFYDISNHLGNVLTTVSDKKFGIQNPSDTNHVLYYNADIVTATDYYPFGMKSRNYYAGSYGNRYGFNGQENNRDLKGDGNSYSAEFWEYDARSGRRWNVDPDVKDNESPYLCFGGNPIFFSDVLGNVPGDPKVKQKNPEQTNLTSRQISGAITSALYSIHLNTKYNRAYFVSSLTPENKKPYLGIDHFNETSTNLLSVAYGIEPNQVKDFVKVYKNYYNNFATIGMWWDGSKTIGELFKAMEQVSPEKRYKFANDFINDFRAKNEKWEHLSEIGVTFGNILMMYGGQELQVGNNIKPAYKSPFKLGPINKVNLNEALSKVGGNTAAGQFLGWGKLTKITKSAADFTKQQLLEAGYTKEVLEDIATGLRQAAKKTQGGVSGALNPASIARAEQVEQIIKTHF